MSLPECVEHEPAAAAAGSVIWLHGLGADGHDFAPVVPELRLPDSLPLRFVFPHAPVRPITINGGATMRAWYDIASLDKSAPQDETGIRASAATLCALIEREKDRGISPERIVVAGFSQGGAIALHAGLRFEERLAGLMALSTWLPLQHSLQQEVANNAAAQSRELPVFLAHGSADPMLTIDLGYASRAALEALGFSVEWHEYPMPHSLCAEEIEDIRRWLLRVFDVSEQ